MNLLDKVAEFEKRCFALVKKAQMADPTRPFVFKNPTPSPSLSGPVPRYSVPATPVPTVNVSDLPNAPEQKPQPGKNIFNFIAQFANQLVEFNLQKNPGISVDVNAIRQAGSILANAVNNKNSSEMLKQLKNIMTLTQNGGGKLYMAARQLYVSLQKTMTSAKPKTNWLDSYMQGEKLKDQADQQMQAMQENLQQGSSMQNILNNPNTSDMVSKK